MQMREFILRYWVQELFALIVAIIAWLIRKHRQKSAQYTVLREGILALLHDRLYRSCGFFISRGYCAVEDRRNLECLYSPYKMLGGDGTGDSLYNKCMDLPLSLDDEKKKEE
jgi:hypothetical protein